MNYLTRIGALDELRRYCPNKIGFEEAFWHVEMSTLNTLVNAIKEHISIRVIGYHEWVDFLDGNGFSVKHDRGDWYIITPLNT